ncbi:MAG: thioredoxin domain-containing protein [Verrucomicrobia bacterium]|nr:thioredoxin domain-containing protein [Verrucomicrobiota bacterium]
MNHLSTCTSPYLLQHAENPVEWYPWGEEAFARAREEQKPIFLSIGYSTCHWCHVMAHESFENPEIAALMNDHFINVKLDREERPDVDRLYMAYVQGLTGSGGWPMSVWLTPELKPFFGGTYFPPENRHGRAGFPSVLMQLSQLWEQSREKIEQEATRSLEALQASAQFDAATAANLEAPLARAAEYFLRTYDEEWGGFGSAPKFPRPSVLYFLLRQARSESSTSNQELLRSVLGTLDRMAAGGIHDHLGGGFHRYSVDREWHVPHFEKMLYDQAQLAIAYLEAWQMTGEKRHAEVVRDILSYVQREMTSPEGGFYSAEDADSLIKQGSTEDAEGAFFVWTKEEIEAALPSEEAALFCEHYGVRPEGNVNPSSDPHGELTGKNVLMIMEQQGVISEDEGESLTRSQKILLEVRSRRPRPHLDDKILCAWNGLMISAFARAGAALAEVKYLEAAVKAAEFIKAHLTDPLTGELRRSWRGRKVPETGFAEDYAFLIQGLLDLYEATFEIGWLQWAVDLQAIMNRLFWDEAGGGYFSSAEGDPHLLVRMKEDYDGAEPSANSVAGLNLLRFSRMLGDPEAVTAEKAMRIFAFSSRTLEGMPAAVPQLLVALQYSRSSGRQVVIAGKPGASDTEALIAWARRGFHPEQVILLVGGADGGEGQAWLAERIPSIANMGPIEGKAALYRCENSTCSAPITLSELESSGILG